MVPVDFQLDVESVVCAETHTQNYLIGRRLHFSYNHPECQINCLRDLIGGCVEVHSSNPQCITDAWAVTLPHRIELKRCSIMCDVGVWILHRRLRSKIWWFTKFCVSHYVSHFAAFFIVARAKISVVKSRYSVQVIISWLWGAGV